MENIHMIGGAKNEEVYTLGSGIENALKADYIGLDMNGNPR